MKSEEIVKVVLKNERLRKIRKNLRDLLKLTVEDKLDQLNEEIDEVWGREKVRRSKIKEHRNLRSAYSRSTMGCSNDKDILEDEKNFCVSIQRAREQGLNVEDMKTNFDLVWIPIFSKWYCTDCVREYEMDKITPDDFPDPIY